MITVQGEVAKVAINLWGWKVGDAVTVRFGSAEMWGRVQSITTRETRDDREITIVVEPQP